MVAVSVEIRGWILHMFGKKRQNFLENWAKIRRGREEILATSDELGVNYDGEEGRRSWL